VVIIHEVGRPARGPGPGYPPHGAMVRLEACPWVVRPREYRRCGAWRLSLIPRLKGRGRENWFWGEIYASHIHHEIKMDGSVRASVLETHSSREKMRKRRKNFDWGP